MMDQKKRNIIFIWIDQSITVDTACLSSMNAVVLGFQSIINGISNLSLIGSNFIVGRSKNIGLTFQSCQGTIDPTVLDYVECHGTGTLVGDPIEVEHQIFKITTTISNTPQLLIGSLKSNVGHFESVSGVASLIKCCLLFQHLSMLINNFCATSGSNVCLLLPNDWEIIITLYKGNDTNKFKSFHSRFNISFTNFKQGKGDVREIQKTISQLYGCNVNFKCKFEENGCQSSGGRNSNNSSSRNKNNGINKFSKIAKVSMGLSILLVRDLFPGIGYIDNILNCFPNQDLIINSIEFNSPLILVEGINMELTNIFEEPTIGLLPYYNRLKKRNNLDHLMKSDFYQYIKRMTSEDYTITFNVSKNASDNQPLINVSTKEPITKTKMDS
ncbi:hypothetical protein ACTA71_006712 [Dictyostelium dimigraforme]